MKRRLFQAAAASFLFSFSLTCFGESLEGYLMPSKCKSEDPASHTKDCALACKSSGFGLVTASGEYVAFNPAGNKKAEEILTSTDKSGDLRVSVQGTRKGPLLDVESIAWSKQ